MVRLDTLVFDLDGTLLDTLPDLVVLTNTVLNEFGFPSRSTDEIHAFVGDGTRALLSRSVPDATPDSQIEEIMRRWKELYPSLGNKLTKPYPYIKETLAKLKDRGIHLGVVSNKFDLAARDVIGEYLPNLFEVIHGEGKDIPRKPNPQGLLRTIDELGSTPKQTAYVGDSPGDVRTARNAGTHVIGVVWGYHGEIPLRNARADAVIEDARDLLGFI